MPIKTPKFWYRSLSSTTPIIEKIMAPLSIIYKFGYNLNLNKTATRKTPIPVLCIGNITAGGSGKTPAIIAIKELITKNNLFNDPYFLSRGYGGSENKPKFITCHSDVKETGDEPLLLVKHSKTIISVNRYNGAKLAYELGADCILMDDGFQNQSLYKDLSLIVINGKTGLGNKKLLPVGPLREPIEKAFKRAHAVIIIGNDETNIKALIPANIPIFRGDIKPSDMSKIDKSISYMGFAGLGHPQKFHDTLLQNNIKVAAFHEFSDHHPYSEKEMETLINKAKGQNARLITTEKDYMRIPKKYHNSIDYLPIELIWENEKEVISLLRKMLK